MALPFASKIRSLVRQSIGYNLGAVKVSEVTTNGSDTSSLIDTYGLAVGGTNDYVGRQVIIYDATGSIVDGEKSLVASFNATNKDATMTPVFSSNIVDGDKYEMWTPPYTVEMVNDMINQAIIAATDDILTDKVTDTTLKLQNIYEYNCLSSFVALHSVEYEYGKGTYHLLDDCEVVWTSGTGTTTTADATFEKVGTYCSKNVAVSVGATTILCYEDISSVDISDCDKVEFWMYSSIALTAGQLQIHIGSTAAISGAEETIDIPAMTAATWYRHSLSLANPHSDTAIISVGIYQVANVADFTFYLDEVEAVLDKSRIYRSLNPNHWGIVPASTNLLQLSEAGYSAIDNNKRLRLNGYAIPAELSADATACTVDPDYVIAYVTGHLLAAHAGGREVDPDDRLRRADRWMAKAEARKRQSSTSFAMNTRWI